MLLGGGLQATDAGADEDANFVEIDLVQVQAGVFEGLPGGVNAELGKAIGAAGILGRRKSGGGVEAVYFAGDLSIEGGGIKVGDAVDAALSSQEILPQALNVVAQGRNRTQAV